MLVRGAPPSTSTFRQHNDLYYLSGIEVPNAYLELDTCDGRTVVYLPHRNPAAERSAGARLSAEDGDAVLALTGADEVRPLEELPVALGRRIKRRLAPVVFTPLAPAEGSRGTRDGELEAHGESLVDPFGDADDAGDILRRGSPWAVPHARHPRREPVPRRASLGEERVGDRRLMREAGRLTALAVLEAMRSTAPGVMEYELGALADFIFLRRGAFGAAYEPIVAAGANIWHGHYGAKTAELQEGAARAHGRRARLPLLHERHRPDVARRRELGAVAARALRVHRPLPRRAPRPDPPGRHEDDVLAGAAEVMLGVLEATTFSKPAYEQAAREALEFPYHLSHPVGMAVHDVGEYRGVPLEPGHVFTVDPMLWVPDERLYVRCEDTVVVTADGIENLTGFVPIDPARDRGRHARAGPPPGSHPR